MKRLPLLCIIALFLTAVQATWGQTVELARWNFVNASGDWGQSPNDPDVSNANVTVTGLTRGSGVTTAATAAQNAWGGNGFNDGLATSDQNATTAVANGNFITFTVKANAGYSISLAQIAACNLRRSGTGPGATLWQYSLDGTAFTDIIQYNLALTTTSGNAIGATNLSTITALQNVPSTTTITFRVVLWGASADNGTWYFNAGPSNQSLIFNGTVTSTPLPLDLLSFKGKQINGINRLDWVTAREKDVSHFELERGTDGQHFSKIASIETTGNNSTADNQYSYTDNHAGTAAYYRLKMVDRDDRANYSDIVVLRSETTSGSIRLYPNPAENTLFLDGLDSKAAYHIADAMGREVMAARTVEGTAATINVAGLPQGVYFLFYTDATRSETIRFVKK